MNKIDTIILNGHVLDTTQNINKIMNIGIDNGKIVDVSKKQADAVQIIDAEGCLVLSGLIDFHIHAFGDGSGWGIARPDLLFSTGVTAAVDAGSAGCVNYEALHRTAIQPSLLKMKTFLNVYSGGTLDINFDEILDPEKFNKKLICKTIEKHKDEILGLKIRIPRNITRNFGIEPFKKAIGLADEIGLPICVHVTDPPCTQEEIVNMLRSGDIVCHVFHGRGETILNENGKILSAVKEARKRGIIFDAAHGNTNYSFYVIKQALSEGFYPDIISTDMCRDKLNISNRTKSLAQAMSLYLNLGMGLSDIIKAVTETPARLMGMKDQIGALKPGFDADVSIFKIKETAVIFKDYNNETSRGKKMFIPQMTICDGEIVFCQQDFNLLKS